MRRHWLAVLASGLIACTSVTHVVVTPDQLRALSGIDPVEQRSLTIEGAPGPVVITGEDVVRLEVQPDPAFHVTDEPWGKLYTLHWGSTVRVSPTIAPGEPDYGPVRVPMTDVTGGTLELTRPNGAKTTALALGIGLGALFIAALITLAAVDFSHTTSAVPLVD